MGVDTDIKRFEEFAQRLQNLEIKTKRIPLERLRTEFTAVFAHRPGIPQRRDWFLKALKHAEQQEIIKFPSVNGRTTWDRTGEPALPKHVTRIRQPPPPKNLWWQNHYWHPSLQWVADFNTLSDEYGDFLRKVNQGLFQGWFKQPAPLNRRSVELTGKEKRLKQLFKTKLFAEGRLERELLNVTSDVMPLAYEFIGAHPNALVFENKEPYNVARDVLQNLPESPYGVLAYGGGASFEDSVRDFLRIQNMPSYKASIRSPLTEIHYVGDLDWAGLRIAHGATTKALKYQLPSLTPASGVHKLMLKALCDNRINHPDGFSDDEIKRKRTPDFTLLEWLSEDVRGEVKRILSLGNRVPEEMLTAEAMLNLWM